MKDPVEQAMNKFHRGDPEACEVEPTSLLAWCNRGECCLQLDRAKEAEQAYDHALARLATFFPAVEGRIRAQIAQGHIKQARQACQAYLDGDRASPDEAESLQELLALCRQLARR